MEKWYTYCVNKTPRQVSNNLYSTAQVTTPSSLLTDMQDCTSSIRHARDPWSRQDRARTLSTIPKATVSLSQAGQSRTDGSSLNIQHMERNTDYGGPLLIAIRGPNPTSKCRCYHSLIQMSKLPKAPRLSVSWSHDLRLWNVGAGCIFFLPVYSYFQAFSIKY